MTDNKKKLNYEVIFIKDEHGNEKYTKNHDNEENYPETNQYARLKNGKPRYAVNRDRQIKFPMDPYGNEKYLKDENNNDYAASQQGMRYARKRTSEEIYPVCEIEYKGKKEKFEYTIDSAYAKDADGKSRYPLGFSGNEYWIYGFNQPEDYPITNDEFYLAPFDHEGKIVNIPSSPVSEMINEESITGIVNVSPNLFHYLTNVKSQRKSRSAKIPYTIYDKESDINELITSVSVVPTVSILPSNIFNLGYLWIVLLIALLSCVVWYMKIR